MKNKTVKNKIFIGSIGVLLAITLLLASGNSLFSKAAEASSENGATNVGEVISSEATSGEPASSEVTSGEPVSSEVSSSKPVSSEVTSSSAVSSEVPSSDIQTEEIEEFLPPAIFAATDDTVTVTKENFSQYFSVNGDATFDSNSGVVTLTPDVGWKAGTTTLKVKISQKQSFKFKGELNLGSKGNSNGADGIAIGFHSGNTTAIGGQGNGMGVSGLPNSLGIKWDTYYNSGDPINGAFMALYYGAPTTLYNKDGNGPVKISEPSGNTFVPVEITYDGSTRVMTVNYNGIIRSAKLNDLQSGLDENMPLTLIMSASTGGYQNLQQIKITSFEFTPVGIVHEYYVNQQGQTILSLSSKESSATVPAIKGETLPLTLLNGTSDAPYLAGLDYVESRKDSVTGALITDTNFPFTNTEQKVYHIFKEGTGNVNYVSKDLQGNVLIASQTMTAKWKVAYSLAPVTINGYTYISLGTSSAPLTGIYEKGEKNITMLYGKNLQVSFESNGGSPINPINVVESKTISKPSDPVKIGYTFAGWYKDNKLSQAMDFSSPITENITLYAKWSNIQYTVTFDGNTSTSGTTEKQTIAYDSEANLTENGFNKTGFTFAGWNTKADGKGTAYADKAVVKNLVASNNGNIMLYAQWTPINYTIQFNINGGSSGTMANQTQVYTVEQALTKNSYSRNGYIFTGWNTAANGSGSSYTDQQKIVNLTTENGKVIVFYAQWTPIKYTISFDGNTQTSGSMQNQEFTYDTEQALSSNQYQKTGYTFTGWNRSTDGSGVSYTNGQVVKNITTESNKTISLVAQWKENEYYLEFNGNGASSGTMNKQTLLYTDSNAIDKNTYQKTGYTFVGWNTKADGGGTSYTDKEVISKLNSNDKASILLYAQWKANNYVVKFDGNKSTSGGVANQNFVYDEAQALSTNNFARSGYTFIGWNTKSNGSGTGYADAQSVKNLVEGKDEVITLYAQWAAQEKTISFDANGGTTKQKSISEKTDNTVSLKDVSEATRSGYTFTGWYTAKTGGNKMPESISMPAGGITYYAQWSANHYKVVFDGNTNTTGSMNNQEFTYDESQKLTVNSYNKVGYIFTNWNTNANGKGESYSNQQLVDNLVTDPDGSITLYAQWTPIEYDIIFNGNNATSGAIGKIGCIYDKEVTLTKNSFSRDGYTFAGWNTQADGKGTSYSNEQKVNNLSFIDKSSVTLYAQWIPNKYTIVFDQNGSNSATMDSQVFTYDASQNLTTNQYVCDGYIFGGWNTKSDGTGTSYSDAQAILNLTLQNNESITLYAKWFAGSYEVQFHGNTASSGIMSNQDFVYDQKQKLDACKFEKIGYQFVGWNTQADGSGNSYANEQEVLNLISATNSTVDLYAQWSPNIYFIEFKGNNSTNGNMGKQTLTYDTNSALNNNGFSKEGYTFTGWNTQEDGNGIPYANEQEVLNLTANYQENITIYAQWSINSYTVDYDSHGGDSTPDSETLDYGSLVDEPSVQPFKYGHTFSGWVILESKWSKLWNFGSDTIPSSNITLHADYKANPHTVTFVDDKASVKQEKVTVAFGDKVPNPNSVLFGYDLIGWFDEAGNKWDFNTDMPDNDIVLTAQWYHVEYTLEYQTYNLETISKHTLYAGDEIPAEAAPYVGGHHFASWVIEGTTTKWNIGDTMPDKSLVLVATYDKDTKIESGVNGNTKNNGNAPKTGDTSQLLPIVVIFSIACVALLFLVFFTIIKKKRKDKNK